MCVPLPPIEDAETWLVGVINLRTDIDHAFCISYSGIRFEFAVLVWVLSRSSRALSITSDHFGKFPLQAPSTNINLG